MCQNDTQSLRARERFLAPDKPGPTVRIACSLVFSCGTLAVTIVRLLVCMLFWNGPFGWFSLRILVFLFFLFFNKITKTKKTKFSFKRTWKTCEN